MPPRARALATIRRTFDPARESGDALLAIQRKYKLTALDAAELLWRAFSTSRKRAAPGSIAEHLRGSDSAGSFPYAKRERYVADQMAPVVDAGTVAVGDTWVPRLGLGCMRIVSQSATIRGVEQTALGIPRSPEASRHALLTAVDVCGVRYFDVARGYGPWPGFGERLLHEWLSARKRDVMVASKVGYRRENDGSWAVDLDPAFIEREVRASAAQFQGVRGAAFGARVPLLYLVARSTPSTPVFRPAGFRARDIARSFAPLVEAQQRGDVAHVGVANVTLEELDVLRKEAPIAAVQNRFSLAALKDKAARAVLERCQEENIPFVMWGLFSEAEPRPKPARAFAQAARALDVDESALTLALLLTCGPNVMVLPGASRRETLYASVEGASLKLDASLAQKLLRAL